MAKTAERTRRKQEQNAAPTASLAQALLPMVTGIVSTRRELMSAPKFLVAIVASVPPCQLMQKLKLLWCIALISIPFVAYADQVDCSNVTRWSVDHRYKRGERVWHDTGAPSVKLYQCAKDECYGAQGNEPASTNNTWSLVGECAKRPS
jgi:hypothetical protein